MDSAAQRPLVDRYEVEIHRWGGWVRVIRCDGAEDYPSRELAERFYQEVQPAAGLARIVRVRGQERVPL